MKRDLVEQWPSRSLDIRTDAIICGLYNVGTRELLRIVFFDPSVDAIALYESASSLKKSYQVVPHGTDVPKMCPLSVCYFHWDECYGKGTKFRWDQQKGITGEGTHVYTPPKVDDVIVFVPYHQIPFEDWCLAVRERIEYALEKKAMLKQLAKSRQSKPKRPCRRSR